MEYRVIVTESAKGDIRHFSTREQRIIVAGIMEYLRRDAEVSTRRRKQLRDNPVAPWEVKIDTYRVFYTVEQDEAKVIAVGRKEHNDLYIRGLKVEL